MFLSGIVIRGLGLAKKYGLPHTANLRIKRIPKNLEHGIYAVRAKTPFGIFDGAAHFGPRPAVRAGLSFEVHCFGLKKNMYEKRVRIEIVQRIRSIKNFRTISALKRAIQADIKKAQRILKRFPLSRE